MSSPLVQFCPPGWTYTTQPGSNPTLSKAEQASEKPRAVSAVLDSTASVLAACIEALEQPSTSRFPLLVGGPQDYAQLAIDPSTLKGKLVVPDWMLSLAWREDLSAVEIFALIVRLQLNDEIQDLTLCAEGIENREETDESVDLIRLISTTFALSLDLSLFNLPDVLTDDNFNGLIERFPKAEQIINIVRLAKFATAQANRVISQCYLRDGCLKSVNCSGQLVEGFRLQNLTDCEVDILMNWIGVKQYVNYLLQHLLDSYIAESRSRLSGSPMEIRSQDGPVDGFNLLDTLELYARRSPEKKRVSRL